VDLHRYDDAETLLAGALATYQSWYGPWHYEVGVTLHNLGCLRYRRGQADAATETLRRAYEVKRAVLGPRHPDLAITLYAQARCTRVPSDSQHAAALLRKACDLLGGVVPPDQPTLAACRRQLAVLQPESRRTRPQPRRLRPPVPPTPDARWLSCWTGGGAGLTANRAERRMTIRLFEERLRLAGDSAVGFKLDIGGVSEHCAGRSAWRRSPVRARQRQLPRRPGLPTISADLARRPRPAIVTSAAGDSPRCRNWLAEVDPTGGQGRAPLAMTLWLVK